MYDVTMGVLLLNYVVVVATSTSIGWFLRGAFKKGK